MGLINGFCVIKFISFILLTMVFGCSSSSKDIAAAYVSPAQYMGYDCEQLAMEAQRIHSRASQMAGRLDKAASNDKVTTVASTLLFWPGLFFLGGTEQQEAEYGRLRGEYDAVQQAAVLRKCEIDTSVK